MFFKIFKEAQKYNFYLNSQITICQLFVSKRFCYIAKSIEVKRLGFSCYKFSLK